MKKLQKIDQYEIVEKLGSGGMGEVYKAYDPVLERNVAIKIMHQHLLDTKKHTDRFLTEARAVAKLVHPNIVTIYEIGETELGRYIVMEYVKGKSLNYFIHDRKKIKIGFAVDILQQMLKGIAAAHKLGILHRDIKPDNILISDENVPKILDFGIAKIQSQGSLTVAGDVLGTIEFMAPEQMLGDSVDHRCDIYAAAVVFYQLLTGRLPFQGDSAVELLFKKLNEDPVPPSYFNDEIPPELDQVVVKALKKEKEDRWNTTEDFSKGIENCFKQKWETEQKTTSFLESISLDSFYDPATCDSQSLRSVFIGRDNEFKKLANSYRKAANGEGQTVVLMGEAGVGKSSLAHRLKHYVENEGAFVLFGECLYQEGLDAYLPYIDSLRRFIEKDSHKLSTERREQFKESIREKVPLLTEFTERFETIFTDNKNRKTEDSGLKTGNLSEGIFYIISQLAGINPVILVIDDLHWADEASLRLFHYLSRNISTKKILLIGISRTDRYDLQQEGKPAMILEMLSRMRQEGNSQQIELKRLKRDDCDLLIDECLANTLFCEEFYESIYKETKGNPFFVIETLKVLQESGSIYLQDNVWHDKRDGFKIDVPNRVEDVFIRRLNGLIEEEREILQVAAVLGYKFDVSLLAKLLENSRIKLIKTLHRIGRDLEILTSTDVGFQFEHPMLRDLLYEEIPAVLSKEYHLMAAEELENMNKDDLGALSGEVAQHYRRGGNLKKAIPLLYQSASRAFKISAYKEASLFFEDLFNSIEKNGNSIPDSIPETDLNLKLGICYEEIGRWEQSLAAYKNLLKISEKLENSQRQIDARRRMGRVYDKLGKWELALEQYQKCLDIVEKYPEKNVVSRIYNNIGLIYFQKGNFEEALKYFENTLKSVDSELGEFDRAHALTNIGTVYNIQGDHQAALESYLKALKIYQTKDNQKNLARVYHNIGMTHTDLENWSEAIKAFDECFSLADDVEDKQLLALTNLNMGKAFARQGNLKKAKVQVNKALKIFKRMTDVLSVAEAYHVFGIIHYERREYEEAKKFFLKSIQINEEKDYYEGIAENYLYYGNLNRDFAKAEQARECYEKAIQAYQKLDLNDKVKEVCLSIKKLESCSDSEIFKSVHDIEQKMEIKNYGSCTQYS